MMLKHVEYERIRDFVTNIFIRLRYKKIDASEAARVLLLADLRGIPSHGLIRLENYVRLIEERRIRPQAPLKVLSDRPAVVRIDANKGLGILVGQKVMRIVLEKARKTGAAWAFVSHSSHFGIAAAHTMLALSEHMIGIAMTNATPLVAPTYSRERMLGTNPLSIAIPTQHPPAIVIDMATSVSASGKIALYKQQQHPIPTGWLQNTKGEETTEPRDLEQGGALLPLGSDALHASHKGYCLASWIDIFSGVLSGANYGPWVPPFVPFLQPSREQVGQGTGHCFAALSIEAFRSYKDFLKDIEQWRTRFSCAAPISGEEKVYIPGEKEEYYYRKYLKEGLPLSATHQHILKRLAEKFDLSEIVKA